MVNASVFLIHQYVVAHQEEHVSNVFPTQTVPLKQQLNAQEATRASRVLQTVNAHIWLPTLCVTPPMENALSASRLLIVRVGKFVLLMVLVSIV